MVLAMNIPASKMDDLIDLLPALSAPDFIATSDASWMRVETVIERRQYQELLPKLLNKGAQEIIAQALASVVPDGLPNERFIDGDEVLWADIKLRSRFVPEQVDFSKMEYGLIPCIAQSVIDESIRMVGFMNQYALLKTVSTGLLTFWSRRKQAL